MIQNRAVTLKQLGRRVSMALLLGMKFKCGGGTKRHGFFSHFLEADPLVCDTQSKPTVQRKKPAATMEDNNNSNNDTENQVNGTVPRTAVKEENSAKRDAMEMDDDKNELPTTTTTAAAIAMATDPNARVTPSPTLGASATTTAAAAAAPDTATSTARRMGGATLDSALQQQSQDEQDPSEDEDPDPEVFARLLAEEEAKLLAEEKQKDATQLELDAIFDQQQEHKLDGVPAYHHPNGFRQGITLFDYQQDGVRWLLHQETSQNDRVPPFYKQIQLGMMHQNMWWNCSLTNQKTKEAPVSPASSILADGAYLIVTSSNSAATCE